MSDAKEIMEGMFSKMRGAPPSPDKVLVVHPDDLATLAAAEGSLPTGGDFAGATFMGCRVIVDPNVPRGKVYTTLMAEVEGF